MQWRYVTAGLPKSFRNLEDGVSENWPPASADLRADPHEDSLWQLPRRMDRDIGMPASTLSAFMFTFCRLLRARTRGHQHPRSLQEHESASLRALGSTFKHVR